MDKKHIHKSIEIIESSRTSHVGAIIYADCEFEEATPAFHAQCIEEYDFVLGVLRSIVLDTQ